MDCFTVLMISISVCQSKQIVQLQRQLCVMVSAEAILLCVCQKHSKQKN